jgi:hypothetical protein
MRRSALGATSPDWAWYVKVPPSAQLPSAPSSWSRVKCELLSSRASAFRTSLVNNGVMRMANKTVRQSVSLPANIAAQVRSLAKARRLSANRMLLELIENGMEAEKRKQQEFFDLAERFRSATDPEEVKRLGDQMGRMVFGA